MKLFARLHYYIIIIIKEKWKVQRTGVVKNLMKGVNVSLIKRKIQEKKSCWSTGPVLNSLRFNPEQTQLHSSVLNIKMTFISFTTNSQQFTHVSPMIPKAPFNNNEENANITLFDSY